VPPRVDLGRERLLAEVLTAASRDGLVSAAHDLSEGGLIQAAVEGALTGETGCRLILPDDSDPFVALFSESAGRVLVAVPRTEESRFTAMCEARGLPATRVGVVDQGPEGGEPSVEVQGLFTVTLQELRQTSEGVLPGLFG
jgi:phosphoribosylformylglycinamidine synthase subunit PurL